MKTVLTITKLREHKKNKTPIYINDNFLDIIDLDEINNLLFIYSCMDDNKSRGNFKYWLNKDLQKTLRICNGMCS